MSERKQVTQFQMVAAIMASLEKLDIASVNPRQFNAIINAANVLCDELNKPHRGIKPGMGLQEWLKTDEVGQSSLFMAATLGKRVHEMVYPFPGEEFDPEQNVPWNYDDFDRCVKLLDAAPELKEHLDDMRDVGKAWAAIVMMWDQLEKAWSEEERQTVNVLLQKCHAAAGGGQ